MYQVIFNLKQLKKVKKGYVISSSFMNARLFSNYQEACYYAAFSTKSAAICDNQFRVIAFNV